MSNGEKNGSRLQWWIMGGMGAILLAMGGALGNHVVVRLDRLEVRQLENAEKAMENAQKAESFYSSAVRELTRTMRELVHDHESRPHKDAVHVRDLARFEKRFDSLEAKLDKAMEANK